MASFFDPILKALAPRKPTDVPKSPLGMWKREKAAIVSYDNVVAAERALGHPVVFRCLTKIASSVQQVGWLCEADPNVIASERAPATAIKDVNALLKSPNDSTTAEDLRYWLGLTYAVFGRVPFKVGVSVGKQANGIYPLDPRYTKAQLDDRGVITGYAYGVENGSSKVDYPTRRVSYRAAGETGLVKAYVHEIRVPALSGSSETVNGRNHNTLGAIGLPSAVVEMLLQRAYDTASGHPNTRYIVTAEKTLTNKQKDAVKEHIENSGPGGEEAGNILFLYNTKVEVHKLDNDLSDIHSKMPADDMTRMIAGAFGIPIALIGLGAADGAKFAGNYTESRRSFWEDTIIPQYLTPIAGGLTTALCPPGARIVFDLDTIEAIIEARAARAKTIEPVTFLTSDEKRELAGYPPLTEEQRKQLADEAALRKAPVAKDETPPETP